MRIDRDLLIKAAPFGILALVLVAAVLVEPGFFRVGNLANVTRLAAFLAVVALGQLLVVINRSLDLSVGAVITVTLLLIVQIAGTQGDRVGLALTAVVVTALAIGALNALMVTFRRVPSILATLATLGLVQGVGLWLTEGRSRGRVPELLSPLGSGSLGPVPIPVIIAAVLAAGISFLLRRTAFGRSLYAVGHNPQAAFLSGIPVKAVSASVFVIASVMAMIAGLMLSGFVGFYDRTVGVGYELDSIAAVVLGGATLTGGRGNVGGTLAAVLGLAALENLLLLLGVGEAVQLMGKAAVLFIAVASTSWLSGERPTPRTDDRVETPEMEGATA